MGIRRCYESKPLCVEMPKTGYLYWDRYFKIIAITFQTWPNCCTSGSAPLADDLGSATSMVGAFNMP